MNTKEYIEKKIMPEIIKNNQWLNGGVDFRDGDPTAILKESEFFSQCIMIDNIKDLYENLKKWDYGVFVFHDIIFFNDYQYGTFVYLFSNTKTYIEHLSMSYIPYADFRKIIQDIEEGRY